MLAKPAIRTVAEPSEQSTRVAGSKFIAWLAPTQAEADADAVLSERRCRFPDATHHCWAYRLGRPDVLIERSSDGGEPPGTAGRPINDVLRRAQLENVTCVVTRYFGGTKLGTGGLARAYTDAAHAALASATVVTRTIMQVVAVDFDHDRTGSLFRVLDEFGLHLVPGAYDARGHGTINVPVSKVDALQTRLYGLVRTGIDLRPGGLVIV